MDNVVRATSSPSDTALSRSRSRYKGNRAKPRIAPPTALPPSSKTDIQQGRSELPSPRQPSGEVPDHSIVPQPTLGRVRQTSPGGGSFETNGARKDYSRRGHLMSPQYKESSSCPAQAIEQYDSLSRHKLSRREVPAHSSKDLTESRNGSIACRHEPRANSNLRTEKLRSVDDQVGSIQNPDSHVKTSAPSAAPVEPLRANSEKLRDRSSKLRKAGKMTGQAQSHKTVSSPHQQHNLPAAAKPAFDAPISAVNAGERRIAVRYDESVISVPVSPSTTAADIVHAAGSQLSVSIDSQSTVLLESFGKLGLERPLRKYEHIRDVLNSWDGDSQNALLLVSSPTGGKDDDLDIKRVSRQQPGEISLQFHYSQNMGCWDKRWVTLRADGQVLAAKKDGVVNICHLSDFDIYIPTRRQLAKKIRPPRKLCFAIKSQQKSSMFLSTENFVHFFCTKDKDVATKWYKAVQHWRSWYLVHVMGEGSNHPQRSSNHAATQSLASDQKQLHASNHKLSSGAVESTAVLPFRLCAARTVSDSSNPGLPSRSHVPPPTSIPSELNKLFSKSIRHTHGHVATRTSKGITRSEDPEVFNQTSLLGRTYTQRKQVQQSHDINQTGAPDIPLPRQATIHRAKPRPLVDLTPKYHEPPQHRKGRGLVPDQIPVGGLVEVATSPERAIDIPPATAWQRPSESPGSVLRSRTIRGRDESGSSAGAVPRQGSNSPEKGPFIDSGLLAKGDRGRGGIGHGRGVKTGDRAARTPMMDLTEASRYAPGSLLATVERHHEGQSGLVLDREKKREVAIAVGEGMK